jgi:hypothetical protein
MVDQIASFNSMGGGKACNISGKAFDMRCFKADRRQ